jgi:hypothetical protein
MVTTWVAPIVPGQVTDDNDPRDHWSFIEFPAGGFQQVSYEGELLRTLDRPTPSGKTISAGCNRQMASKRPPARRRNTPKTEKEKESRYA